MWVMEVKRPDKDWKLFAKYAEEEKARSKLKYFRKKNDGNKYRLREE